MLAVSNTSPLLNLAIIGRLDLLQGQFPEVIIPPAVLTELRIDADLPGSLPLREAVNNGWLRVEVVENIPLIQTLEKELDRGESEAIALALQINSDL